jgi:hypothetical protein
LRRSFFRGNFDPVGHYTGYQILSYYLQYAFILDPCGKSAHQAIMVYPVKEFGQIHVDNVGVSFHHMSFTLYDRVMR